MCTPKANLSWQLLVWKKTFLRDFSAFCKDAEQNNNLPKVAAAQHNFDNYVLELETEIGRLKDDNTKKDKTIANLRSTLSKREVEMDDV